MPRCLENLDAHGNYGHDIRQISVPDTLVDVCPGNFITYTSGTGVRKLKLMSAFTWDTNLATTQAAAKLVFEGVSLGELDADSCLQDVECIPYANYRQGTGFDRSYTIVDANGDPEPTTWVKGQGFTFGKNPDSNALTNNTIQKTSTSNLIVFRAIEDSGPSSQSVARVEFAE